MEIDSEDHKHSINFPGLARSGTQSISVMKPYLILYNFTAHKFRRVEEFYGFIKIINTTQTALLGLRDIK